MDLLQAIFLFLSAIASAIGIEIFRRFSLRNRWVDVPNERSSHDRPTPRGAGLVIVLCSLAAYLIISYRFPAWFSAGYLVGAVIVAGISWIDDLYSVPFIWRLLVHFSAAAAVVVSNGYWTTIGVSEQNSVSVGSFGAVLAVIWIVWMINSYNFMDGIDGIAGIQAAVAATAWAIVAVVLGRTDLSWFLLVIFGSCVGFLFHNWSPARVFMGDVGSAFLGFTFAAFPLLLKPAGGQPDAILPLAAVVLIWPFFFDSVLTLITRSLRRQRVWIAHREHLYQRLVASGFAHSTVSLIYGCFALLSAGVGLTVLFYSGNLVLILLFLLLLVSAFFAMFVAKMTSTDKIRRAVEDVR